MAEEMNLPVVLAELGSLATKDVDATAKKQGVPVRRVIGVSTAAIRKLARRLGQDERLATQLWRTGMHEARILALLITPFVDKTVDELDEWVGEVDSWGVCDQFAKRLSEQVVDVADLAARWVADDTLYTRRAGLALVANHCMKREELDDDVGELFATLIVRASRDDRQHVKQACCWALRELGKIDSGSHEVAMDVALNLLEALNQASVWVGRCAHKELELLVKVPERRRLISRKSKTASKHRQ